MIILRSFASGFNAGSEANEAFSLTFGSLGSCGSFTCSLGGEWFRVDFSSLRSAFDGGDVELKDGSPNFSSMWTSKASLLVVSSLESSVSELSEIG